MQLQDDLRRRLALAGPHDAGDEAAQEATLCSATARRPCAFHLPPRQDDALLLLHCLVHSLRAGALRGGTQGCRVQCEGQQPEICFVVVLVVVQVRTVKPTSCWLANQLHGDEAVDIRIKSLYARHQFECVLHFRLGDS